jgi:hypothetical protein
MQYILTKICGIGCSQLLGMNFNNSDTSVIIDLTLQILFIVTFVRGLNFKIIDIELVPAFGVLGNIYG